MAKLWTTYKAKIAPNAKLYLFDLAGYGNTPVSTHENGVYLIAGWSDKVFDMLDAYEKGSSAIEVINSINLTSMDEEKDKEVEESEEEKEETSTEEGEEKETA